MAEEGNRELGSIAPGNDVGLEGSDALTDAMATGACLPGIGPDQGCTERTSSVTAWDELSAAELSWAALVIGMNVGWCALLRV